MTGATRLALCLALGATLASAAPAAAATPTALPPATYPATYSLKTAENSCASPRTTCPTRCRGTLAFNSADPAASTFVPRLPATNTVRLGGSDGSSLLLPVYGRS
jgi:uncharacterized membrane protein